MVDIETYRARIGSFDASSLSTTTLKPKIKLRCKVQRQVSMKCSVQTLIFLWMVVSTTTLCASLLYQEHGNTYTGMTSSCTDSVYSDKQLCTKYLFKHVHEFYWYILKNYAEMLTEMLLLYTLSRSSTLAINIWIPGSNTRTTLMENIYNGTVHGTCSYLIGNVGSHAYHGNPPKRRGENIYDLQRAMVIKLSQMIAPGTGNRDMDREWNMFTNMLRGPDLLTRVEVAGLKDMSDVFVILMDKGKIDYGNYEVVKRIMSQLQLMQCHDIITEHEERMASISQDGQYKKRMVSTSQDVQHEEQVASTSQGSGQQDELRGGMTDIADDLRKDINTAAEGLSRQVGNIQSQQRAMGEAVMIPNVLNLIRERVDVSVGFVRIPAGHGTGFRVGHDMFMTAYHVLAKEIDFLLREILFPLNLQSEETVRDLISRLNVPIQRDVSESLKRTTERAVEKFIDDSATNIPLLIQKLEGLTDTEALSQNLTMRWKENCTVEFVNHGKFSIDWRLQFGKKNRDIVIVKLLETQTGQDFPRALLLDGNYRQHGNIHVVRFINEDSRPQVVVDQATQVIQNNEEAQRKVTEAVEWWKNKFPDHDEAFFHRQYAECCAPINNDTGRVIIRASESFVSGSSGSPVVYLFNPNHLPVVTMIYQRGFPEFYYEEKERFEDLQVDSKCFFEGATTMKKLVELLDVHGKTDLKDEIFSQPAVPRYDDPRRDMTAITNELRGGMTDIADDLRDVNVATEGLSRDVGNIQSQQRAMGDEVRALREDVDILAQHAAGFVIDELMGRMTDIADGLRRDIDTAAEGRSRQVGNIQSEQRVSCLPVNSYRVPMTSEELLLFRTCSREWFINKNTTALELLNT